MFLYKSFHITTFALSDGMKMNESFHHVNFYSNRNTSFAIEGSRNKSNVIVITALQQDKL